MGLVDGSVPPAVAFNERRPGVVSKGLPAVSGLEQRPGQHLLVRSGEGPDSYLLPCPANRSRPASCCIACNAGRPTQTMRCLPGGLSERIAGAKSGRSLSWKTRE